MADGNIVVSQPQKTSGWAIAGIICAFLAAPLGLIFSIVALVKISKDPSLKGKGLAIVGLIISILIIPVIILAGSAIWLLGVTSPVVNTINRCNIPAPFSCDEIIVEENIAKFSLGATQISSNENVNVIESVVINNVPCTGISNGAKLIGLNDVRNSFVVYSCNGNFGKTGDKFDGEITVKYEMSGSEGIMNSIKGTITGTIA